MCFVQEHAVYLNLVNGLSDTVKGRIAVPLTHQVSHVSSERNEQQKHMRVHAHIACYTQISCQLDKLPSRSAFCILQYIV